MELTGLLFVACEHNPHWTGRLSIPNVLRVKKYSENETINRTLQMQVRRKGIRYCCSAGSLFCYSFCEVWLFSARQNTERII